jgi:protein TonB
VSLTFDDRERRREGYRWAVAALVVVGLHLLGAVMLRGWQIPVTPHEIVPAAIMMDLEPVPLRQEPAAPEEPPPPEPEIVDAPPLPAEVVPEVVLPQVVPKPKPVERKRAERVSAQPAVATPAPAVEAPAAPPHPAPAMTTDAMARFQRLLSSHLEREKRYPRASQQHREQGIVLLRFTMDREGKVLAARIERGSGFAALDQEVLGLVQRAQPLPALPPEIAAAQLELVVPVQFSLR